LLRRGVLGSSVARADNEGWSVYGAPRSQPVATGRKWNTAESRSNRRKPLPWGCDRLPPGPHGKEGVDGSSPSEGFEKVPAKQHAPLPVETPNWLRGNAEGTFRDPSAVGRGLAGASQNRILQEFLDQTGTPQCDDSVATHARSWTLFAREAVLRE
jgi:hypothetical protein